MQKGIPSFCTEFPPIRRKAFFDEDEEGFWLDTGNLSKQDKAASKSIA